MSFFKQTIAAKIENPLDSLPTSYKAVPEDGNATLTVRAVRAVESKTSSWAGIVWECEVQIDGTPAPLTGGQKGIAGVDFLLTVQSKDGSPLSSIDVGKDCAKIESRFGAAYEAAGHPLAETPEGFLLPDGLSLDSPDLGPALAAIEGRPIRVRCWAWVGKKGKGVEMFAVTAT